MDTILNQEISSDRKTWNKIFDDFPVEQIKILKQIGQKIWITKPTAFIVDSENTYILGYTMRENVLFDTNMLNSKKIYPYTTDRYFVTERTFHKALMYRIELLDTLNINVSDIRWYEISRRCLFNIYMDLDMKILYERELKLLNKIEAYNKALYKFLNVDKKKLYDLYHTYDYKENDGRYTSYVMTETYKWKTKTY